MEKEHINSLALRFLESKDKDDFDDLYQSLVNRWKVSIPYHASNILTSEAEIRAVYEDTLLRVLERYDKESNGDFILLLEHSIKRARISLVRKVRRRSLMEIYENDNTDQDAPTSTISECYDQQYSSSTEEKVFRNKEKRDKQELVSHLIKSAKTLSDEDTEKILKNFSRYKTLNALAKALGMHHEVVKRKLRKLSRYYDANRFGDISDYLAV